MSMTITQYCFILKIYMNRSIHIPYTYTFKTTASNSVKIGQNLVFPSDFR